MRTPRKASAALAACALCTMLSTAAVGGAVTSPGRSSQIGNAAASTQQTQFHCEKKFARGSQARSRCFNQLPGASCAHPLEVQKTDPNFRGDTRYFTVNLKVEPYELGEEQQWSWAPKKNVAICPYPNGVVLKTSLGYRTLPNGMEIPVGEYDIKNISEYTTRAGGSFTYNMTDKPIKSWYLVVRGYFIHPPWAHHG